MNRSGNKGYRGMIRTAILLAAGLALTACGGGNSARVPEVSRAASPLGPVAQACLSSPRAGANTALCSCIQLVADQSLGAADQRLASGFFADPEAAHAVRLSDTPRDDAFWARYTAFAEAAENLCRPYV
jgi:hypothetical protein